MFQLSLWDIQPSRGRTSWNLHEPVVRQGTSLASDILFHDLLHFSCKSSFARMDPLESTLNTRASMDIRF